MNAENNGVYPLPDTGIAAMQQATQADEMIFRHCDLRTAGQGDDALALLAKDLKFPTHFGQNFDALYDCLTDLSWQETSASVIVLSGVDTLHACDPESWDTLLSVFAAACEFWQNEEVAFMTFIDSDTNA